MPRVLILEDQGKGIRHPSRPLLKAGKTYHAFPAKFDSHPGVRYWRIAVPRHGKTFLLEDGVEAVLPTNPHRLVVTSLRSIEASCACESWTMHGPALDSELDGEIRDRIKLRFRQHTAAPERDAY